MLTDFSQREQSMLTFESASVLGVNSIVEKLSVRKLGSRCAAGH